MNVSKTQIIMATIIILVGAWFLIASSKSKKQPYLTVVGSVDMADGLGKQSAELIDILKDDITIGFKSCFPKINLEGTPPGIRAILKNTHCPIGKVIIYEEQLGPRALTFQTVIKGLSNQTSIRIAYSMFESSLIPPEWVVALNYYFDAVAVPDKFLIDVYKNSGVNIPIFELPLGLNLEQFFNAPLKNKKNSPMVFANFSAALPRKNQLALIKAFYQAFGNSQDVRLRLNSRNGTQDCITAIRDEIRKLGVTNVEFTQMKMDKDLYFTRFQSVDCYVSLSSGEGFSIQPREAMALGIPVIATDNTGQSTICATNLVRKVPSLKGIPAFYPLYNDYYGLFYDCTLKDSVQALRDMYENYDYYLQKGAAARTWTKKYSFNELKRLYLGLIKPKKVVLSTVNSITPDCLFTDSKELCEKFNKLTGVPFEDNR